HLIIGMLLLFGFNLPETHHLYYLASSFSNFWRRINIYWKDFMQKLFFMPLFFRLKKRGGNLTAIIVATMITFLATWFLHAWQWFWLRGTYLFTAPDILFWTLLGVLVVANSLVENKRGPDRTLSSANPSLTRLALLSVKTTATFAVICTLWSLWISESVVEWLSLWTSAQLGPRSLTVGASVFALATAALFGFYAVTKRGGGAPTRSLSKPPPAPRALVLSTLSIAALLAVGNPAVYFRLGPQVTDVVRDLRAEKLSARDAALLERGYYENLTVVNRFNSQLWEIYMQRPADWTLLQDSEAVQPTDDFLLHELRPGLDIMFKDAPLRTNRFGMRDREYDETPAPGTYRIALIGGSHSMGSGVADNETFEAILEERLNAAAADTAATGAEPPPAADGSPREGAPGRRPQRYEILNFAVGGYSDLHGPIVLEERALRFRPDAVFYIGHPKNTERLVHHLAVRVERGVPIPYPELQAMVEAAGAEQGMPMAEIERRLLPSGETIVRWALRRMADLCKQNDVLPVWIGIPSEAGEDQSEEGGRLARWAQEAGFRAIDLSDVFGDVGPEELRVAPWDMHPNARGHRMVADGIWNALRANDVPPGLFQARD
ncbi:MAG TPA: SGNH/GDSL hydrolase family protein, partial [bacterium]|nr:SGNH/GDSL hydrolase family protein [bacterium]